MDRCARCLGGFLRSRCLLPRSWRNAKGSLEAAMKMALVRKSEVGGNLDDRITEPQASFRFLETDMHMIRMQAGSRPIRARHHFDAH